MAKKEKWEVKFREGSDGEKYFFKDIGAEYQYRPSFRLWISSRLINMEVKNEKENFFIEIPKKDVNIIQTEKGTRILKPMYGFNIFNLYVECGYRGDAEFNIISKIERMFEYVSYESPAGNLGVSRGTLVITRQNELRYKWRRIGRTYNQPKKGITTVDINGDTKVITDISDFDELAKINE